MGLTLPGCERLRCLEWTHDGGVARSILFLDCTTLDVWNGNLTVANLQLGNPRNRNGQIIVEKTGRFASRNCDFGQGLLVLTKDEGTAEFSGYVPGEQLRIRTQGGDVTFNSPRLN